MTDDWHDLFPTIISQVITANITMWEMRLSNVDLENLKSTSGRKKGRNRQGTNWRRQRGIIEGQAAPGRKGSVKERGKRAKMSDMAGQDWDEPAVQRQMALSSGQTVHQPGYR